MFADDSPWFDRPVFAHLRRHPFVYLSAALHVATLAVLVNMASDRANMVERGRQQQAIDTGSRLTEQARLEKRVHDMARIESLLEQSAAAGDARKTPPPEPAKDDDIRFSAQPAAPRDLLDKARALARKIDEIERETKAEQLAKLLDIPKKKALAQVDAGRKPDDPAGAEPKNAKDAAAKIEQLEARARAALEERRRQLAQKQNGTAIQPGQPGGRDNAGRAQGASPGMGPGKLDGQGGLGGQGLGTGNGPPDDVLARIARFDNPDLPDRLTKEYASDGFHPIFGGGAGDIPDPGAASMVKGSGRIIGPGGEYATRVYVNRWYLIGPFEGKHGDGLFHNDRHPPEQAVVLDAAYRGKDGRMVKWEYLDMARYPLEPPDPAEDAVYYGYTELMSDRDRDLTIWVGADDDAQLWVNDRLAWTGGDTGKQWFFNTVYNTANHYVRDYNLSEGKRVVHFRKGRNKLFFKLSNGPTRLFFSLVLTQ